MVKVKTFLASILIAALFVFSGCAQKQIIDEGGLPSGENNKDNGNVGLANPASVFCIEQGGKLKPQTNDKGEYSICVLPDGSEMEEWEYYRKEHKPETPTEDLTNCKSYFDGCNTCFVTGGKIGGCTRMACSDEMKKEPKCMLYNDEKIIGKILEMNENTIHILQGDIVEIFQIDSLDISKYKINDIVEATFNRDDQSNNILFKIKNYEKSGENLKCTREYVPVCAQTTIDGNGIPVLETFSNKCMAGDNQIIHQGVCGEDSLKATEIRACTMEYMPVCAKFNGNPKTFGNDCGAEGLEILHQGECGEDSSKLTEIRVCTADYAPVCAKFNGGERTFSNSCGAEGLEILHKGECQK